MEGEHRKKQSINQYLSKAKNTRTYLKLVNENGIFKILATERYLYNTYIFYSIMYLQYTKELLFIFVFVSILL